MRPAEEVRAEAAGDWVTAPVDALEARVRLLATAAAAAAAVEEAVHTAALAGRPRVTAGDLRRASAARREAEAAEARLRVALQAARDALWTARGSGWLPTESVAAGLEAAGPAAPDWKVAAAVQVGLAEAPAGDRS